MHTHACVGGLAVDLSLCQSEVAAVSAVHLRRHGDTTVYGKERGRHARPPLAC